MDEEIVKIENVLDITKEILNYIATIITTPRIMLQTILLLMDQKHIKNSHQIKTRNIFHGIPIT